MTSSTDHVFLGSGFESRYPAYNKTLFRLSSMVKLDFPPYMSKLENYPLRGISQEMEPREC